MATKTRKKKKSAKKTSVFQKSNEIYQSVTDRLIEALESGTRPWVKPWVNDPNGGFPTNIERKKGYRGVNPWLLNLASLENGYVSKWWGTYKQWSDKNGQVRKGETSKVFVVFSKSFQIDDVDPDSGQPRINESTGLPRKKNIYYLQKSPVFNLDQVDNIEGTTTLDKYRINKDSKGLFDHESYYPAEDVITNSGAKIVYGGNQPHYNRKTDSIVCPPKSMFPELERYYRAMFHELCHYMEKRTGFTEEVKDKSYALGELVAEIGSCYVSEFIGVPVQEPDKDDEQAAAYLKSWLQALKNDRKFIFTASTWAMKACDKLLQVENEE